MDNHINNLQLPMVYGLIGVIYVAVNIMVFVAEAYFWRTKVTLNSTGPSLFSRFQIAQNLPFDKK